MIFKMTKIFPLYEIKNNNFVLLLERNKIFFHGIIKIFDILKFYS